MFFQGFLSKWCSFAKLSILFVLREDGIGEPFCPLLINQLDYLQIYFAISESQLNIFNKIYSDCSMSLTQKKTSIIFAEPKKSAYRLKIQSIIEFHKNKLLLNDRSNSKSKPVFSEKLSLLQAKKIQNLHSKTVRCRRSSLNMLLNDYDRNCTQNIENKMQTIDEDKLNMFRRGVYYRSEQRASGTGTKKITKQDFEEVKFPENEEKQRKRTYRRAYSYNEKGRKSLLVNNKLVSTYRGLSTINV